MTALKVILLIVAAFALLMWLGGRSWVYRRIKIGDLRRFISSLVRHAEVGRVLHIRPRSSKELGTIRIQKYEDDGRIGLLMMFSYRDTQLELFEEVIGRLSKDGFSVERNTEESSVHAHHELATVDVGGDIDVATRAAQTVLWQSEAQGWRVDCFGGNMEGGGPPAGGWPTKWPAKR